MAGSTTLPERFGRYRVLRMLGKGGMGAVYLAEDSSLGRQVAIKVPHFEHSDASVIERFVREARLAASIQHPSVCAVYEVGEIEGIHYFTMPFIEGTPLSELVERGQPWPAAQAVQTVKQLALAVGALHARGIIHRDLKPANVMVTPEGLPVLMDFGLARSFMDQSQRLTATGQALGTPAYMAPEQVEGKAERMGPATDVYALGAILYQMLTGRLPFEGPPLSVYGQILYGSPPPLTQFNPTLDAGLCSICLKAMARNPGQRYANMTALVTALDQWAGTPASALPTVFPQGTTVQPQQTPTPAGSVQCPQCGKRVRLPPGAEGKRLFCPGCKGLLDRGIPAPTTQAPAAGPTPRPVLEVPLPRPGPRDLPAPPPPPRRVTPARPWPVLMVLALIVGAGGLITWSILAGWWKPQRGQARASPTTPATNGGSVAGDFTNTLGMRFRRIGRGSFRMGATDGEAAENEGPVHRVTLTRDISLGIHEVTRGQFEQFVKATGYRTDAERGEGGKGWNLDRDEVEIDQKYSWRFPGWQQSDQEPVVNVSWNDAVAFCQWLSKKEGKVYDLPTEAEWEYACRAGSTTPWSFGDDAEQIIRFGNVADVSGQKRFRVTLEIKGDDGFEFTSPVGSLKANAWGLHDMHGNVWEWCADSLRTYADEPASDPFGGSGEKRVLRGGSFGNDPLKARSSHRLSFHRGNCLYNIGFRVVLRAEGPPRAEALPVP